MKYNLYISLIVSMLLTMTNVFACGDAQHHTHSITHNCADHAGSACLLKVSDKVDRRFTPPQEGFVAMRNGSINSVENAVFECTYYSFTNEEALTAFEYAISIWEANLSSLVPIRISVSWSRNLPEYALAGCEPSAYGKNVYGLPMNNILYPSALYNKLIKEDNASIIDMAIDINADFENWYFGLDGNTPEGSYDFVTVILHELAHGLGIHGSATSGIAFYYDGSSYLSIFDKFMEDEYGIALGDRTKYKSNSEELTQAFANPIRFNGDLAKEANGGNEVKLYSPDVFESGSSIYHLDTTFNNDDQNSLLTHELPMGRAIHTPGPVLLGILKDLGWDVVDITHTSNDTDDSEATSKSLQFKAQSEYGLDANNMTLFYRNTEETAFKSASVENNGQNTYAATATDLTYGSTYEYYFEVKDIKNGKERTYEYPADAIIKPSTFYFGVDTIAPYIPAITSICPIWIGIDDTKTIQAYAYDNSSLASVKIEWYIDGVRQADVEMQYNEDDKTYSGEMASLSELSSVAEIKYRVNATDASSLANVTIFPEDDFYYADVTHFTTLTENLFIDFEAADATNHCLLNGMDITSPNGFTGYSLNTEHPYSTYDAFGFTLCHEFTVGPNTSISFDEIVLVEQAYTGITYPSTLFYDYVIVEASTDKGETWSPVAPGYDASYYSKWDEFWYTDLQDIDGTYPCSEAFGTPDLYKRHHMSFSNSDFKVGDNVIVRFRLQSDMVMTGWGWNIDNLLVDLDGTSSVNDNVTKTVNISPNPAQDYISISSGITSQVTFFSLSGKVLKQAMAESGNKIFVGDLPQGVVLVKIENNTGVYTSKLIRE